MLTPRQKDILRAYARGMQAEGIAFDMKISRRTVENHITHLKETLRAKTITHAVVIALTEGLL